MSTESCKVKQTEKSASRHRTGRGLRLALLSSLFAIHPALPRATTYRPADSNVPPQSAYTGDTACAECHASQARSYAATPHATDSNLANQKTILGDFDPQNAVLRTSNPSLAFVMLSTPDGYYQSEIGRAHV